MDNIKYLQARERRLRRNRGPQCCAVCGIQELFLLANYDGVWLCYEHRPGGHAMEEHHIGGLHRGASVMIPANAHRLLTVKTETMLPKRFRSRQRSVEEEAFAMVVGATLVSDAYVERADSPINFIRTPRSAGTMTISLKDFTVLRQRHPSGVMIEVLVLNVSADD